MAKSKGKNTGKFNMDPRSKRWLGGLLMGLGVAIALTAILDNPAIGIAVGVAVGAALSLDFSGKR